MKLRIGIQRALIGASAVVLVVLSKYFIRAASGSRRDLVLYIFGLLLVAAGYLIRMTARGHKMDRSRGSEDLVTDGIYSYSRNPMYLGTFCIGAGCVLAVLHPWALLIFLAGYFSIYIPQVMKEEAWLGDRFGQQYRDYCRRVPRIFPSLVSLAGFLRAVVALKWAWTYKESASRIMLFSFLAVVQTIRVSMFQGVFSWQQVPLGLVCLTLLMVIPLVVHTKEAV